MIELELASDMMDRECFALLDNNKVPAGQKSSELYYDFVDLCEASTPEHISEQLSKIKSYTENGYFAVGYFSYELGYSVTEKLLALMPENRKMPLLCFGIFSKKISLNSTEVDAILKPEKSPNITISKSKLDITKEEYVEHIKQIKSHILSGDTYQVNYTTKYKFQWQGSPLDMYYVLRDRQKVEYGALLKFPKCSILSRSPELFVKKQGTSIHTKPMKGTIKRGSTQAQDEEHIRFLANDEKTRAENVMIVDLLRNDLSRICKPGSVSASNLFEIQTYETLHQMISRVSGVVDENLDLSDLLQRIFPCGSITGAPKISTMKIIRNLEPEPREIYTGAIGHIDPCGDFCFNVPIRTLVLNENGTGEMGVGSGIVHDSDPVSEFDECCLKGEFFTRLNYPDSTCN